MVRLFFGERAWFLMRDVSHTRLSVRYTESQRAGSEQRDRRAKQESVKAREVTQVQIARASNNCLSLSADIITCN